MNDPKNTHEIKTRLFEELGKARFGMLGLTHSDLHFQPMTPFCEADQGRIWFFSPDNSDLAREIGAGGHGAMFTVVSDDRHFHACIAGELSLSRNAERIDKFWNDSVAAWFAEGRDDPRLTLIRFDLADAEVWLTDVSPARYAIEIQKANETGRKPDVGDHTRVDLH